MEKCQVIELLLDNQHDAGNVFECLSLAIETGDPLYACEASRQCMDVARRLERRQRKDPAHQPAPETVVCQDWHEAVREIRTGTPNSAMSAIIAPTPSTPGWMDKAAEALPDKSKPTIRTNGVAFAKHVGDRWQHWCGPTLGWCTAPEWCANAAPRWEVATDEQLRQAGTRVTN